MYKVVAKLQGTERQLVNGRCDCKDCQEHSANSRNGGRQNACLQDRSSPTAVATRQGSFRSDRGGKQRRPVWLQGLPIQKVNEMK